MSIREKLQSRSKRQYRTFPVEGMGDVTIRSLSANEQLTIEQSFTKETGEFDRAVTYLIACLVDDEGGQPSLTENDRGWITGNSEHDGIDAAAAAAIFREIHDLCGLGIGPKEAVKNS